MGLRVSGLCCLRSLPWEDFPHGNLLHVGLYRFRVYGLRFAFQALGLRVYGSGFRVWGLGLVLRFATARTQL